MCICLVHRTQHHTQDLSNALRMAAVYKYGGLYVDSDMIITGTAFTTLPAFVAKQDDEVRE